MSADGVISEALSRIEHKLDLLLLKVFDGAAYTMLGDQNHACPVCTQPVQYSVDLVNKVISRKCGCSTGKQPPIDLESFGVPKKESSYAGRQAGSNVDEDRSDPDPRRRPRRG